MSNIVSLAAARLDRERAQAMRASRRRIADEITRLIGLLDTMDGDPDMEPDDDGEPGTDAEPDRPGADCYGWWSNP